MTRLELFEPAMCCNTGVCGPSVDEELLQVTGIWNALNTLEGYEAVRYNLSSTPQVFVQNAAVSALLQKKGVDALPITTLNGEIKKTGAYPTISEVSEYTHVQFVTAGSAESGCCGGSSDCC